jgi:hypothetical protein
MMTVTVWKLDEYGYRKKSYRVYGRVESVTPSDEECDTVIIKTYWETFTVDMTKYDVEVSVRTF